MKKILETPRLILREMTDDDFPALKKIISDPDTMKYYPQPYDDAGVNKWINWCKASYAKRGFGLWAVVLKETGEMIGDCGVSMQCIDDEDKPEIGYHLRKDYHRQGIGKEMTQAVKDYFFTHFDYDEVYSYMNVENVPSYKTAEANGMSFRHFYVTKTGERCRIYSITREEWKKLENK
ncbi:MAG: GNAT family N-acetyltransferase [Bacilli bacterium]|nr:GNAT family N-acetyltransferase [Bacilli bacterium]